VVFGCDYMIYLAREGVRIRTLGPWKTKGFSITDSCKIVILQLSDVLGPLVLRLPDL
jgi:hypothetical protein